jgi:hypothetical protein
MYIDRRVFVTGKESILNTHNFVEAGFLPRGGEANDVLVKCTSKDYHTKWDSLLNILTPLLPTLLQGIYTFRNGLTESPNFTIEWGGNLIRNTQITGQLLYNVDFRDLTGFAVKANTGNINLEATIGNIAIEAQSILSLSGNTNFIVETPLYVTALQGALLQHTALLNGNVEYTPYGFPLIDGNSGQYLSTNGSGTLSWSTFRNKCEVLYFNNNPTNIVNSANGVTPLIIDTYNLSSNTLTTNGSYIDIEILVSINGTTPGIPALYYNFDSKSNSFFNSLGGNYNQTIKVRTYRVSNTTFLTHFKSEIIDASTNQLISTNIRNSENSLILDFNNDVIIDILITRDLTSDYTVELKHFSITKFLK